MLSIRRLAAGDEEVLSAIAADAGDFDLADRDHEKRPLSPDAARRYLDDPSVLHWVAQDGVDVIGHLHCQLVRKNAGDPCELLLYEIGVRASTRRRGVGRALVQTMTSWMIAHGVTEVWVLADNEIATAFYAACGFEIAEDAPVYLTRTVHR